MGRKIVILCLVVAAAAIFLGFGLHQYLTIEGLKARTAGLVSLVEQRPLVAVAAFMLVQVTALSLSLPGSVLALSLAGGAIFGPVWGTFIVLASLTIGDSLSFLIARYVLRDWVQRTFRRPLAAIDRGLEREGAFYLLTLRLLAIVPFCVVNLTMGLTKMPLRVFAPVSLIGLVPATLLYVNAGTHLAEIGKPSDIYSPALIASFVALGLLPLALRLLLRRPNLAAARR